MISSYLQQTCLLTLLAAASLVSAADHGPTIAANDNRTPGGELQNGVLTIHLELGEGQWHPESEDGDALTVYAFGETGRPLQNPGPLIRVAQGTLIHAFVHNGLTVPATVHGLHERPGNEKDAISVQPGGTQEVRFKAGVAGSYYYWATTTNSPLQQRTPIETQLSGAFIVDPPGTSLADRVFVIGVWYKEAPFRVGRRPQLATLNGKSWPYAERLTFRVGETVRWRWLNPSVSEHSMHLHGFYYQVDGDGDGERYYAYNQTERLRVVTHLVETGETFDMTWVPERAGRWLFHCHMLVHMSPVEWRTASAVAAATTAAAQEHHYRDQADNAGMGGLVLGITVTDDKAHAGPPLWHAERKLQLKISEGAAGVRPLYTLAVHDPDAHDTAQTSTASPAQLIGPPLVLTQGQPTEIEIVNRTKQPTAIHWHGIELESYYDGVAGWTGTSQQTTPAVQPGESFVARMTPPRAGTFIYHTHWHDQGQLENGLYGPLIVLPPGQNYDPRTDKTFLFSIGVFEPFGELLLINGRPQHEALQLNTRIKYRFRLINIAPNQARMRASLRQGGTPVQWRILAKDGADLPASASTRQTADLGITVGETYDFEYEADAPQSLTLEILQPALKRQTRQPLVFADERAAK